MRVLSEFARDLQAESHRLESEWTALNEVWHDERAHNFYIEIIVPYQTHLNTLENVIRELGDHLTETGSIQ